MWMLRKMITDDERAFANIQSPDKPKINVITNA